MIGMQHIDERNTAVPDWFVGYYRFRVFLGRCGGAEPADGRADRAGVPALLRDERSATHPRRTRKGINKQNDR